MTFPALSGALRPDLRFHLVATDDVGRFAAAAFERPDAYLGRVVDVADALTVVEMKAAFERVRELRPDIESFEAFLRRHRLGADRRSIGRGRA